MAADHRAQRLEIEERQALLDAIQASCALLDRGLRFVAVNQAYEATVGRTREQLIGHHIFDLFPDHADDDDDNEQSLRQSLEMVFATGEPHVLTLLRYDIETDGVVEPRYWNITNSALREADGTVEFVVNNPEEVTTLVEHRLITGEDIADTVQVNQAQHRALSDVFSAELDRLENLADLSTALVAAGDIEHVGQAIADHGLDVVGAIGGALVVLEGDLLTIVATKGVSDESVTRWSSFVVDPENEPFADAIASGQPQFLGDRSTFLSRYPNVTLDVEAHDDHQAWAIMPLRNDETTVGAIGLIFDEPQVFPEPMRLVMRTLADLALQATLRAQLTREYRLAVRSVEKSFQPRVEDVPGLAIEHLYRPATVTSAAGGDWYDTLALNQTQTLLVMADVASHGAVAIGEMARCRATVHAFALAGCTPKDTADRTSRVISRLADSHTTALIALFDATSGTLTWTCAGHPYPVLVSGGTAELLDETHGPPLGVDPDVRYRASTVRLVPGDLLVMYTDGLIERPGTPIDVSMQDLEAELARSGGQPDDLPGRIYERFHPVTHHRDDVAILAVRFDGISGSVAHLGGRTPG